MAKGMICAPNRLGNDLKMDLLWTNASPTSNFSAQTISIDGISADDFLLFECKSANIQTSVVVNAIIKESGYIQNAPNPETTNTAITRRSIEITDGQVTVGDAYYKSVTSSSAGIVANANLIPYKIYKITGVA